jgi:hypothetical protein
MRIILITALAALPALVACGPGTSDEPAEPATEAPAATELVAGEAVVLPRSPSADGARVFFISPADGDTVSNPVNIAFGIEGMGVAPAGDATPDTGHHHLLIDTGLPDLGMPIPADDKHVHFGKGQTETEITLSPGEHTLQMLLGDYLHIPHDPPLTSDRITIYVE